MLVEAKAYGSTAPIQMFFRLTYGLDITERQPMGLDLQALKSIVLATRRTVDLTDVQEISEN